MTQPIQAAVRSLSRSAEEHGDDTKLKRRLGDLQALLADDLAWLEVALAEATGLFGLVVALLLLFVL